MKWVKRFLILLIILVVAGYFGIPKLLETSWVNEKVRSALEKETGRDVTLGKISFGWTSGLSVSDVVVKQKAGDPDTDGPLFTLGNLSLKLGLGDILKKKINIEKLSVEGSRIVVIRDKNGRFNFSDLIEKAGKRMPVPSGEGGPPPAVTADIDLSDGTMIYVDEPLGTRIEMKGITGTATWESGKLVLAIESMMNGGEVRLKLDSNLGVTPSPFRVEEFTIDGAALAANMPGLGYFLPLLGEEPQEVSGNLVFSLKELSGTGFDLASLEKSLTGSGRVFLEGGTVMSGPVAQIYSAIKAIGANDLGALGSTAGAGKLEVKLLSSDFAVKDGRVATKDMKLEGKGMDLSLSGSTGLDGTVDYRILAGALGDLIAKNKNLKKYIGEDGNLPLTFKGSLASPDIGVDAEQALRGAMEGAIKENLPGGIDRLLPGRK